MQQMKELKERKDEIDNQLKIAIADNKEGWLPHTVYTLAVVNRKASITLGPENKKALDAAGIEYKFNEASSHRSLHRRERK